MRLFCLFFILFFYGVSSRANPCDEALQASLLPSLFKKTSWTSPEIVRLFVRNPAEPIQDPNYLENIIQSLRIEFAPWFEENQKQPFFAMLKRQHEVLMRGQNGDRLYFSPTERERLLSQHLSDGGVESSSSELRIRPVPVIFHSRTLQRDPFCPKDFLENPKKVLEQPLEIEGIPSGNAVGNLINEQLSVGGRIDYGIIHFYADPKTIPTYLARMAVILTRLSRLPKTAGIEVWGSDLADYVQLFSQAVPFARGNFSLAMAQVNYFLLRQGYR